jgi:hypothetical protein
MALYRHGSLGRGELGAVVVADHQRRNLADGLISEATPGAPARAAIGNAMDLALTVNAEATEAGVLNAQIYLFGGDRLVRRGQAPRRSRRALSDRIIAVK